MLDSPSSGIVGGPNVNDLAARTPQRVPTHKRPPLPGTPLPRAPLPCHALTIPRRARSAGGYFYWSRMRSPPPPNLFDPHTPPRDHYDQQGSPWSRAERHGCSAHTCNCFEHGIRRGASPKSKTLGEWPALFRSGTDFSVSPGRWAVAVGVFSKTQRGNPCSRIIAEGRPVHAPTMTGGSAPSNQDWSFAMRYSRCYSPRNHLAVVSLL